MRSSAVSSVSSWAAPRAPGAPLGCVLEWARPQRVWHMFLSWTCLARPRPKRLEGARVHMSALAKLVSFLVMSAWNSVVWCSWLRSPVGSYPHTFRVPHFRRSPPLLASIAVSSRSMLCLYKPFEEERGCAGLRLTSSECMPTSTGTRHRRITCCCSCSITFLVEILSTNFRAMSAGSTSRCQETSCTGCR